VEFDDPSYEELKELVAAQQLVIEQQSARIAELEARIVELERRVGRTPRNSSMPPSAEGLSKPPTNRAERRAQKKRRPGKQPGDEGHHLAQVSDPDEVITHRPRRCASCEGTFRTPRSCPSSDARSSRRLGPEPMSPSTSW